MIGVFFSGRFGNQLFQYAYARYLRWLRGDKEPMLFNFYMVTSGGSSNDGFEDKLKHLKVLPYQTLTNMGMMLRLGSIKQKIAYTAFRFSHPENSEALVRRLLQYGILRDVCEPRASSGEVNTDILSHKDLFLSGYFQETDYLKEIRPLLLDELTPVADVLPHNKELMRSIVSSNAVCVSIRRGDYLSPSNKDAFYVCDKSYFDKAIQKMKTLIDNPTFVFFSNDIDWVRRNIHVDAPCLYERGDDPEWETIRLMYNCKHFIISNSTFSWWAQFLCRNEEKIVVSPDRWYNIPEWSNSLIESAFIKIPS